MNRSEKESRGKAAAETVPCHLPHLKYAFGFREGKPTGDAEGLPVGGVMRVGWA
jgi:hypothetical protein